MENTAQPKEVEAQSPATLSSVHDENQSEKHGGALVSESESSIWERPNSAERKVRDLFVWTSLSHPERTYPKGAFTTIATIALLLSIIFAFFQEWFLILLSWATVFLLYALSKVTAQEVEHRITTQGIISLGHTYLWHELGAFWFSNKGDHRMLHVGYRNVFGQILFLINREDEEIIRDELAQFLPFIEVWQKSTTEKLTEWVGKKFPLEKMLASKSQGDQSKATAAKMSSEEPLVKAETNVHLNETTLEQTETGSPEDKTIEPQTSTEDAVPTSVSPSPPSSQVASS